MRQLVSLLLEKWFTSCTITECFVPVAKRADLPGQGHPAGGIQQIAQHAQDSGIHAKFPKLAARLFQERRGRRLWPWRSVGLVQGIREVILSASAFTNKNAAPLSSQERHILFKQRVRPNAIAVPNLSVEIYSRMPDLYPAMVILDTF